MKVSEYCFYLYYILSCQPGVTVTLRLFARLSGTSNRYVTCVLILSTGKDLYTRDQWIPIGSGGVYKLMFYLAIVDKA